MILYSVTVNIDEQIHSEWIEWMRNTHVPDVMKTGYFSHYRIFKLTDPVQQGHTYSFQYFADSQAKLDEYHAKHSPALQAEHHKKYEGKYAAFRTVLEVIE